jgi:hypothetical protein
MMKTILVPLAEAATPSAGSKHSMATKEGGMVVGYIFWLPKYSEYLGIFQNVMPGRADGSRGSAPSMPYLNEVRPAAMPSEGLSGRRGAPTGAKVRGVTLVIYLMFLTEIFEIFLSRHSC